MSTSSPWSRRQFLQSTGALTAAVSGLPARACASILSSRLCQRYACVGSLEGLGSLHVFAVDDSRWTPIQVVASPQPAALAVHPFTNVLYVANRISAWQGLPCGSVEAYKMDPDRGTLMKLGRQPLSLSATLPTDLAVSPDGRHLVIASHGGGAYNLLPLRPDGGLEHVASIVKETGCGPHLQHQQAAHPHTVLFDPAGKYLLSSDMGTDRVNSFRVDEGHLERTGQASLPEGSGPSHMVFHPSGHLLYVCNWLESSITGLTYHASEGRVGKSIWSAPLSSQTSDSHSVAIHPSGRFLYTSAEGVDAWSIDPPTGGLRRVQPRSIAMSGSRLTVRPDGGSLYMLHEPSGEVQQAHIGPESGNLGAVETLARVAKPRSLVFIPSARATG